MSYSERMTPLEIRASIGLSGIFGLRMLGMFLILPVFAIYAEHLPGGQNHTLIGIALGAYGLTQALLQLPFGMLSDRYGRKRVIYFGLLLLAAGSFIAAFAQDIYTVILGRAIQGAGAISAAVTALAADLTREEHRTKAMAMIGATIGVTFAFSLIAGPAFYHVIGIPGIFAMTGLLAIAGMAVVYAVVPDPQISRFHSDAEASAGKLKEVLQDGQLLRLNFGIFALHAAQMAIFVVVPFAIQQTSGLDATQHWQIYLPVLAISFLLMIPPIVISEKKGKVKPIFVASVGLLVAAQLSMAEAIHYFWGIAVVLTAYFLAFNILEASLPSLISRMAPAASKGAAMGVYNTSQSLGIFMGAVAGGYLSHSFGPSAVFLFGSAVVAVWLWLALTMQTPPQVRSKMFHIPDMSSGQAQQLSQQLAALEGVVEASVIAEEGVAYLKVTMGSWDEQGALKLIEGEKHHGISQ